MTVTASVFPAWGNPMRMPRSLVLIVLTARASVSPLCARASLSFQRAIPPLAPSRFFLSGTCEEKTAEQRFSEPGWERAHAGSDPACLAFATQRDVSRPFFPTWPASLCKRERSGLVRGKWRWADRWQHVTGSIRCWGAVWGRRQAPQHLFCRGAVRPLNNDHRRSSLKFTTRSRDLGAPLTLPTSILPLHLPSLRLTALKKKDMRGCLNWMSQWLHISAHPLPSAGRRRPVTRQSHAGPLQRSLDAPTLQLDRRIRRSTLWWFFRSIRPSSSLP